MSVQRIIQKVRTPQEGLAESTIIRRLRPKCVCRLRRLEIRLHIKCIQPSNPSYQPYFFVDVFYPSKPSVPLISLAESKQTYKTDLDCTEEILIGAVTRISSFMNVPPSRFMKTSKQYTSTVKNDYAMN